MKASEKLIRQAFIGESILAIAMDYGRMVELETRIEIFHLELTEENAEYELLKQKYNLS